MCGISGFADFRNLSSEMILREMSDALSHRGPDDNGHFLDISSKRQVGLGHRRLSIMDTSSAGHQPMEYQGLHITFNGEIYNFREIREDLKLEGHQFRTETDTEVILHAYSEWGAECIRKFIGMFAFVIFDSTREELFCARDRAGVKPFFYYWHKGLFLFGSELKVFHKHPDFVKELNPHAVGAFVQFGNVPTPHCIFRYCHKLPPGHLMTLKLQSQETVLKKYWDVYDAYNKPQLKLPLEVAIGETENILANAFRYRMVSDVPVGVFLSGGYDSSCLTAVLQRDRNRQLKTFTIAVPDIGLNEGPYARKVAEHLETDHHEFTCTGREVMDLIRQLPYYYDEPFGDSSAIPTSLVCKLARESVTVALSADGGDEVFAGYNRYDYLMKYGRMLNSIPQFMRHGSYRLMSRFSPDSIPFFSKTYNFHNRYEKLKLLLKDPTPKNMMLSLSKQYDDAESKKLFRRAVRPMNNAYQSDALREDYYSPLRYMMAIDYQTYLLDDILQKVDRASMRFSLEAREPFLDHRIIEWAARLPDNYKYHGGVKKYILREIVHKHVPKEIMDRPKMGFAIPIEKWLLSDLSEQVLHYLDEDHIQKQGIFDPGFITAMKKDFLGGKRELGQRIWYLLMFQMWYEKWMD